MNDIYDTLLQLPIFQGISKQQLLDLAAKIPFHFLKYTAGNIVVHEGDSCMELKFVLSGSLQRVIHNENSSIRIQEDFSAPSVISPNYLFGPNVKHPATIKAIDDVSIMQLDKQMVVSIMREEPIFMINFLNTLSRDAQSLDELFLGNSSVDLPGKFAYWISGLTQRNSSRIVIHCKLRDLYGYFGTQRSGFVDMLNKLTEQEILTYSPRNITITNRAELCKTYL